MNLVSRVAVFHGPGQPLTLDTVAVPDPGPGEIMVRPEYVTLCRSDINTYAGKRTEPTPTILGHEIVGRVTAIGPSFSAPNTHETITGPVDARGHVLALGDRVTWSIFASNPDSPLSRRGLPQKGDGLLKYGHEPLRADHTLHGGLAEYCLLRRGTVIVRLGEALPLPVAALVNCAGATTAGALRMARPDDSVASWQQLRVLVSGAGMLGTLACAMLHSRGVTDVTVVDVNQERLDVARQFGARTTLVTDELVAGNPTGAVGRREVVPFDVILEFSGAPAAMSASIGLLTTGGVTVWVGGTFPQPPLALNPEDIIRRLVTIRGLHNYNGADLLEAAAFLETEHTRYPFADLVDDAFTLDTVQEAFDNAVGHSAHRVGVRI